MKVYTFKDENAILNKSWNEQDIHNILEKIAENSDTNDLVVAIYLLGDSSTWRGAAYRNWFTPSEFYSHIKRSWSFVRSFGVPEGLPERFRLIRMVFGTSVRYPRTVTDRYEWQYKYLTFHYHLASVFAHELHHYRRYHLGMHPGEGEQSACKWAIARTNKCGFAIEAMRRPKRKTHKVKTNIKNIPLKPNPNLLTHIKKIAAYLNVEDLNNLTNWLYHRKRVITQNEKARKEAMHFEKLKNLPVGAELIITRDDHLSSKYLETRATKIRNLRSNSYRMKIKTQDDKIWVWPMTWLEPAENYLENVISGKKFG